VTDETAMALTFSSLRCLLADLNPGIQLSTSDEKNSRRPGSDGLYAMADGDEYLGGVERNLGHLYAWCFHVLQQLSAQQVHNI
jgi:hypothetical protein